MDFDSCIQGSSKKHHAELLILRNKNNAWRLIAFEHLERSIRCMQDTITPLFVHPFAESQLVVLFSGIVATEKIESGFARSWDKRGRTDEELHRMEHCKPSPDEVLEMMFCTCSRNCVQGKCPCIDNGLLCTDACAKQECGNFVLLN